MCVCHHGFQKGFKPFIKKKNKGFKPLLALDNPFPMEVFENLFGEKWAFAQLAISGICTETFYFNDNNDRKMLWTQDLNLGGAWSKSVISY